ncbi:MAG: HDOD domain-containing protein [Candidatus Krumholzibacteria bacterium]|jgi:putative nucleotidyltransferase with HDIG domain|nr:HDOD domain-containing protein [Candidatus Krumholzibacteria bacterium]
MGSNNQVPTLAQLRDSVADLPTIPESLSQILRLLEDPNSGARDLAKVIRNDAPLTSKILRLSNSPLYQKRRTVTTLQDCVAVLGFRTVRQVALCVTVVSTLARECEKRQSILCYRDLWRHCVDAGAAAKWLAQQIGHPEPDDIFTCGLLHDLGKFVLTLQFPEQYAAVVAERRKRACRLVDLERERFGYDHAQAGAVLGEAWNFPPLLVATCGGHHTFARNEHESSVVGLADYLANTLTPPASDLGFDQAMVDATELYGAAGLSRERVESCLTELRDAIDALAPLQQLD